MKTTKIIFSIILILGILNCFAQTTNHEKAESFYSKYLSIYRNDNSGHAEIKNALQYLHSATELEPQMYKYVYALGAGYKYLKDYAKAKIWYQNSIDLTNDPLEKNKINQLIKYCDMRLMESKIASRTTGPGILVSFSMKEGKNELEDKTVKNFPKALPETLITESSQAITQILDHKIGSFNSFIRNEFIVISLSNQRSAETHFNKGIETFDNYFKQTFSFQKPTRFLTILITENPMDLVRATNKLYPEAHLEPYAPFLGYYNKSDNLIAANGGIYGYGTLLHELMHANLNVDFPDAPVWFNEGMATLYERSEWQGNLLKSLPNWRFNYMKESSFQSLEQWTKNISNKSYNLGEIRMLLLYFDHIGKIGDFYKYVKANKDSLDLMKGLQQFNLDEQKWREFIAATLREYQTELYASSGTLSNPDEIKYIQSALNATLGKQLKVDGFWGSGSQNALIEFQQKNQLDPDGNLGPKTRAALEKQYDSLSLK